MLRIAVVDDESSMRRTLVRLLVDHDVASFDGALPFLACVEAGERFDVVLSDLMMPGMSGAELHDELRRVAPEQLSRLVVLTGGAVSERTHRFLHEHAGPILEKPFARVEVRSLIDSFAQLPRLAVR